jgi:APA family basic amino acid/polyamine antiporter
LDLTLFGIGVIIGTGLFVLTGEAAAGYAGPAVALSYVVGGIVCALAGALLRGVRLDRTGGRQCR